MLRKNVRFHTGDLLTAEDVKFSFERYRGTAAKLLHDKVAAVEVADPLRVRFKLKKPWPDFLTFYATPATGAYWWQCASVHAAGILPGTKPIARTRRYLRLSACIHR